MENYLTLEWITKASWATLALSLEDRFYFSGKALVWPCPSGVVPAAPGQDSKNFSEGLPKIFLPTCLHWSQDKERSVSSDGLFE